MATDIAMVPLTQEQFQEAMMARMRPIIGEMMPTATLADITKRGVEEAFFKPRKVTIGSGYHERIVDGPPWINEFVEKELAKEVKEQIAVWIAANAETIKVEVQKTLAAGVTGCVVRYFTDSFQQPLSKLKIEINDRLSKLGQSSIY